MAKNIDEIQLPKVNEKLQKSRSMQNKLALGIYKVLKDLEKENDYQFMSWEVDNVLLDIVKKNHERYILEQFKE